MDHGQEGRATSPTVWSLLTSLLVRHVPSLPACARFAFPAARIPPRRLEAAWDLPEGPFTYYRGEVVSFKKVP
jgi:hypothetical protein